MSILVHPDKNKDDEERAQKAFEGGCQSCNLSDFYELLGYSMTQRIRSVS